MFIFISLCLHISDKYLDFNFVNLSLFILSINNLYFYAMLVTEIFSHDFNDLEAFLLDGSIKSF